MTGSKQVFQVGVATPRVLTQNACFFRMNLYNLIINRVYVCIIIIIEFRKFLP